MKVIVDIDDQDITLPCVGKVATCSDCNHFVQHYGRRNDIEARVAGTRFYKTIKNRSTETIACNHFELRNE